MKPPAGLAFLPCPFCASPRWQRETDPESELAWLLCGECGAAGPRVRYQVRFPWAEAGAAWNARACCHGVTG